MLSFWVPVETSLNTAQINKAGRGIYIYIIYKHTNIYTFKYINMNIYIICSVLSLVTTIFTKIVFFWYDCFTNMWQAMETLVIYFLLPEDIHMTYLVWLVQNIIIRKIRNTTARKR